MLATEKGETDVDRGTMASEVIMPALGMAQETGKVLRWLVADGAAVRKGEPLLEVETDKVTVEVEAPADGTLGGIGAAEGEDVPVGRVIAWVLGPGETVEAGEAPETVERASTPATAGAVAAPPARSGAAGNGAAPVASPRRTLASPKARRLAAERGIAIEELVGSGPHGAVVAADVESVATAAPEPMPLAASEDVKVTASEDVKREPLEVSSIWRVMADRTQRSWQTVPHFFLVRDVDATRLDGWRDAVRRRPGYESVTHTDLLVKLLAAALAEHPRVNASWRDGALVGSDAANVGVAVAVADGLVVPVIHDAGRLGLRELAERRAELVAAARDRRLRPEHVQGATFTISNLGMFGVDAFLAIVDEPQSGILAVGRIADRVVAVDGRAVVRPTMTLSLSFDHRVVDGAAGARFLDTLAALVEEPAGLVT